MKVIEIHPGEKNFELFEKLPELLYPSNSIRFKQSENLGQEFIYKYYIVTEGHIPKARAILYNNPALCYQGMKTMCIGNYESVDDKHVSTKLLETIFTEARKQQVEFIIGPMNGSTWDNYRFSTHQLHPNFLLEPYHHLYYNEQFITSGFQIISRYSSTINQTLSEDKDAIVQRDAEFSKRGVTIRTINIEHYENELNRLYPFIQNAFQRNFLYTPVSWSTFKTKYMEATKIIMPEHVLIAEDNAHELIGFIFCYDDLFHIASKRLIIKTLARDPSPEWSGLGYVLMNKVIAGLKKKGYQSVINAFMIENGASTALSTHFGSAPYKNYVLYGTHV
jgi:L-amino acid N-acyltransferase YncA